MKFQPMLILNYIHKVPIKCTNVSSRHRIYMSVDLGQECSSKRVKRNNLFPFFFLYASYSPIFISHYPMVVLPGGPLVKFNISLDIPMKAWLCASWECHAFQVSASLLRSTLIFVHVRAYQKIEIITSMSHMVTMVGNL